MNSFLVWILETSSGLLASCPNILKRESVPWFRVGKIQVNECFQIKPNFEAKIIFQIKKTLMALLVECHCHLSCGLTTKAFKTLLCQVNCTYSHKILSLQNVLLVLLQIFIGTCTPSLHFSFYYVQFYLHFLSPNFTITLANKYLIKISTYHLGTNLSNMVASNLRLNISLLSIN